MIFIVHTPKKKRSKRKEEPIDRQTIEVEDIACPACGATTRLTGKVVGTVGKRVIFCALCGASFWEDEGLKKEAPPSQRQGI